jgi:hypothetical protein
MAGFRKALRKEAFSEVLGKEFLLLSKKLNSDTIPTNSCKIKREF